MTIRAGETTALNVSLAAATPRPEPPPAPVPRRPPSAAGPPQPGSIVVTDGEDGAVFAPDVKFTEVNHEFATLIGAYAGYVFGGEVMLGGGGYWQANSTNGLHMAYGGPVVEWRALRGKTIGLNLHALVGGGTLYSDFHDGDYGYNQGVYVDPRGRNGRVVAVVPPGYGVSLLRCVLHCRSGGTAGNSLRIERAPAGQRRVSRDLDQQPQRRDWRDLGTSRTLTPNRTQRMVMRTRVRETSRWRSRAQTDATRHLLQLQHVVRQKDQDRVVAGVRLHINSATSVVSLSYRMSTRTAAGAGITLLEDARFADLADPAIGTAARPGDLSRHPRRIRGRFNGGSRLALSSCADQKVNLSILQHVSSVN